MKTVVQSSITVIPWRVLKMGFLIELHGIFGLFTNVENASIFGLKTESTSGSTTQFLAVPHLLFWISSKRMFESRGYCGGNRTRKGTKSWKMFAVFNLCFSKDRSKSKGSVGGGMCAKIVGHLLSSTDDVIPIVRSRTVARNIRKRPTRPVVCRKQVCQNNLSGQNNKSCYFVRF